LLPVKISANNPTKFELSGLASCCVLTLKAFMLGLMPVGQLDALHIMYTTGASQGTLFGQGP
jgi:hypothetical protein